MGRKHRSKDRRPKSSSPRSTDVLKKLASAIAKGDRSKARELIVACGGSSTGLNAALCAPLEERPHRGIAAGETVLHVAARAGDAMLVELLVAAGADVNLKDLQERTAMHIAGGAVARALLESAERHGQRVDLDVTDATGCSVNDAVFLALRDDDDVADEGKDASEWRQRVEAAHSGDYEGLGRKHRPRSSEEAWQSRLREESYFEEAELPGSSSGALGGWGDSRGDSQGGDEAGGRDAEGGDWFSEIAAAMAARQAKRAREAREKAEATAAERRSERDRWQRDAHAASAKRQKQAEAAFERFEEARRRADALAQDEARAEARARYLAAWVALAPRADGAGALSASEVPWPSRVTPSAGRPLALDEVALHVLSPEMDAAARRRALTTELRRWHPDKFVTRWGARLLHAERDDVLVHVKQVSQCLTELLSK
jgi:hypothetical protein